MLKKWFVTVLVLILFSDSSLESYGQHIDITVLPGAGDNMPAGNQYANEFGMHFKLIPAGTFVMGSPINEPGRDLDELQHQVTLTRPYYLQATEVTQRQWHAVMGSNPSFFAECGLDCPVERVSWEETQEFIARINRLTGRHYRLPTEAEFEFAARAGTTSALANGDLKEIWCNNDDNMNEIGWYCGNANDTTHPVGQKRPNPWGLYDMHGNVWEWCQDAWNGETYESRPATDPVSAKECDGRVIRGGSWQDFAWHTRAANRDWCVYHYRNELVGFRLALSP